MALYVVTGQILTHDGDWHGSVSVPTFYLDSDVQGITTVGKAVIIAREVVNPLGTIAERDIDLAVYEVVPGEPMSGEFDIDGNPIPRSGFAGNVGHVCAPRCERHARQRAEHDAMGPDHDRWCAGAMLH